MKAPHSFTSSFRMRGRNTLKAMGWAIAVAAAIDLCCGIFLPSGYLVRIQYLTRQRVSSVAAPDIQVVGDSVARSGFISTALTDGRLITRNDAMPGSSPIFTYLLLRDQFDAGHIPKVLVIAHSPHTFGHVRYPVVIGSFAHWREIPSLVLDSGEWAASLYAVLTRMSYVLRHRDSFKRAVVRRDLSFFKEPDESVHLISELTTLRRYQEGLLTGRFENTKLEDEENDFYRQPFHVESLNDKYFRKLLALAKSRGVKVLWFTMPIRPGLKEAREQVGYEQSLHQYLDQFQKQGKLKIIRSEVVVYEDRLFRDTLHLNAAGAAKLACELRQMRTAFTANIADLKGANMHVRLSAGNVSGEAATNDTIKILQQVCAKA